MKRKHRAPGLEDAANIRLDGVQMQVERPWHSRFKAWCRLKKASLKDVAMAGSDLIMDLDDVGKMLVGLRGGNPQLYSRFVTLSRAAYLQAMNEVFGPTPPDGPEQARQDADRAASQDRKSTRHDTPHGRAREAR
jgi:hypothetical protein